MKSPADLAAHLFRKAGNDLTAAKIGLRYGAPLDTVCFHVQQSAEKLLKGALAFKNLDYPYTHELRELLEIAVSHYPELTSFLETVPEYTEFAVRFRYDELTWVTVDEAARALGEVERLRDTLAALGLPVADR